MGYFKVVLTVKFLLNNIFCFRKRTFNYMFKKLIHSAVCNVHIVDIAPACAKYL